MKPLGAAGLIALADALPPDERHLLLQIAELGLMTHAQAAHVLALDPSVLTTARLARRRLQRMTELGLLARLSRRIGGLRAGSAGYVYYLGPAGQRAVGYWQGRGLIRGRHRPEPGSRYVRHRLAVAQTYVDALRADRRGELELLDFAGEPSSWRTYLDELGGEHVLKPDSYLRVGRGAYEDRWFIEVDLGTESRPVIARKLRAYWSYYLSGDEQRRAGVFPRVLWLTNSEQRHAALLDVCAQLPAESWRLFGVGRLEGLTGFLTRDIEQAADDAAPGSVG